MKKPTPKKVRLGLDRETVRTLVPDELTRARGGDSEAACTTHLDADPLKR